MALAMSVSTPVSLALALCLAGCANPPASAHSAEVLDAPLPEVPEPSFVDSCEPWDEWDKPARPFALMGNSYYVGTCGISAILVAGDEGHVLLDSGVPEAVPHILASIRMLGFDPGDIGYILMSHEHFDHVGGHAALKEATGALVVASQRAKAVLESGVVAADDPQAASGHPPMTPVTVDRVVTDADVLKLGKLEFTAHAKPGHSPGALSWTWTSCNLPGDPPVCRRIAYVDSLSAVSADEYRFSDHPEMVGEFRDSIDKVRALSCDYMVNPHPSAGRLIARLRDGTFGEPGACRRYADGLQQGLDARLAREAAE